MVEYFGIFFNDGESLKIKNNEKTKLEKLPNNFHCTFKFAPKDLALYNEVIGKDISITLVGYGNDGKNSGFEIDFPQTLKKYFNNFDKQGNLKVPHITTSMAIDGKAVNTANLKFDKLNVPILLTGKFGYFIREKDKEYISFDKVKVEECIK